MYQQKCDGCQRAVAQVTQILLYPSFWVLDFFFKGAFEKCIVQLQYNVNLRPGEIEKLK